MVPEAQARRGLTFRAFVDPRCFRCEFFNACAGSIRHGRRYKIVAVRRASHTCPILGEKMYVVEVEEEPLRAAIEARAAVPGVRVRFERIDCGMRECPSRRLCAQAPLDDGEPVEVVRVVGNVACPLRRQLVLAELRPLA